LIKLPSTIKATNSLGALAFVLLVAASTAAIATGCKQGPATVFTELDESRRLAADLRVQFNKAADASNRAVMADSDEASIAFAQEAAQSSKIVDHDAAALGALLSNLGITQEAQLLGQFGKQLASYREVDRSVLALAVQNSNLKAQRLSFGPGREAADHFKAALADVVLSPAAKDRCHAEALATKAILSVRELQVLQGPHIASADDAAMTRMEKEMATLEAQTSAALAGLDGLATPSAITSAKAAFDQFKTIEGQIVALSRRNTNVRSLELSLKDKPPLTAACDDTLLRLQAALAQEGSKATR
jgi:hypothetical protein